MNGSSRFEQVERLAIPGVDTKEERRAGTRGQTSSLGIWTVSSCGTAYNPFPSGPGHVSETSAGSFDDDIAFQRAKPRSRYTPDRIRAIIHARCLTAPARPGWNGRRMIANHWQPLVALGARDTFSEGH